MTIRGIGKSMGKRLTPQEVHRLASCHKKTPHNRQFANEIAARMRRRHDCAISAYRCVHCGYWHVGENDIIPFGEPDPPQNRSMSRSAARTAREVRKSTQTIPAVPPRLEAIDGVMASPDRDHVIAACYLCAEGIAYMHRNGATPRERDDNAYSRRIRRLKDWLRAYSQNEEIDDKERTAYANRTVDLKSPYASQECHSTNLSLLDLLH